jgi:hypothetical protein
VQLGEQELAGAVDRRGREQLALLDLNRDKVEVEIAGRKGLEGFLANGSPSALGGRREMPQRQASTLMPSYTAS